MRISDWSSDVCSSDLFFAANQAGLGIGSSSLLAIGSQVLLTGGLHEDGLADTADGFGGGRDRDAKLAIMRDSRIGTYGVLALVLLIGLRYAALSELANSLISISDEYDETVNHTASVVDRKSTRLNSSPSCASRMPSSA